MSTFNLPDLGEGLAEAEILAWHVKPGDYVLVDQPLISVETAKAVIEVPVPFSGLVKSLRGAVGDIVATGAPLLDLDADGFSGTVVGKMPAPSAEEFVDFAPPARERRAEDDTVRERSRALPAARAVAKHLGLDLAGIAGSGRAGVIKLDDVLAAALAPPGARPPAAALAPPTLGPPAALAPPAARASAAPRAADLRARALDPPAPGARGLSVPDGAASEPLRGARRAMAQSMAQSRDQVAGSTVVDDADVHAWADERGYMPRLMRAMIAAWRAEPALNAWYDPAANSRILLDHIDLAVAIDTPGGLIVPVLRNIEQKSPDELRAAVLAHKRAARERTVLPEVLRGFTLMLSNFGTLAGRYAVPLVVPPAVAILGAGKVRKDAVVVADSVVAHRRMPLSLSFDHRCITGGEACRFLAAVIADLEQPT